MELCDGTLAHGPHGQRAAARGRMCPYYLQRQSRLGPSVALVHLLLARRRLGRALLGRGRLRRLAPRLILARHLRGCIRRMLPQVYGLNTS